MFGKQNLWQMLRVLHQIWKLEMTIQTHWKHNLDRVKQRQTSRILKEISITCTANNVSGHIKCIFFNCGWKYVTASVDDGQHKVHGYILFI